MCTLAGRSLVEDISYILVCPVKVHGTTRKSPVLRLSLSGKVHASNAKVHIFPAKVHGIAMISYQFRSALMPSRVAPLKFTLARRKRGSRRSRISSQIPVKCTLGLILSQIKTDFALDAWSWHPRRRYISPPRRRSGAARNA